MPLYEVRENCEYIHEIEASSKEEALSLVQEIPHDHWMEQSWMAPEVELIEEKAPLV